MQRIHVHGLGRRVPVDLGGARVDELVAAMHRAWSRGLAAGPGDGPTAAVVTLELLAAGEDSRHFSPDREDRWLAHQNLDALLTQATQRITLSAIEAGTGELLLFHAGAVCHPGTGASLVFVAPGGTGKTTLAKTLGGLGYGYLSDETVGITADLRILPYPKPLSTRDERTREFKHELSPDELGLGRHHENPRVTRLVLLARSDEADEPRREPLGLLDAIAAVTPETSALAALDRGLHRCADLIAATGAVERWTYAEASSLVPWVATLLGEPDGPGPAPAPTGEAPAERAPLTGVEVSAPPEDREPRWQRGEVADLLVHGTDGLVLHAGTLSRLGPVGVALWQDTQRPRTLAELAAGLEARFGVPEGQDVREATRTALDGLVGQGVLRREPAAQPD